MRTNLTTDEVQAALDAECARFRAIVADPRSFVPDALRKCADNVLALRRLYGELGVPQ